MTQPTWITTAGSLGSFSSNSPVNIQLEALPSSPAVSLTYTLLNGKLPEPLKISSSGVISGTPKSVGSDSSYSFTCRVVDNLGDIRDRTFSITVYGSMMPHFTTPEGSLLNTEDSTWVYLPVAYSNPDPTNKVNITVSSGVLPPGLFLTETGTIYGYGEAPVSAVAVPVINSVATATTASTNIITCDSTAEFIVGRPITFTGAVFGGVQPGITYFVASIVTANTFTISTTPNGTLVTLTTATGLMSIQLPQTSVGQPTIYTYSFKLTLTSALGNASGSYSITVINQLTPVASGGPGRSPGTRKPTILNTRAKLYPPSSTDPYYGYYLYPLVPATTPAYIGTIVTGEYFAFKVNGYDFDLSNIGYAFYNLPLGLVGDPDTGWVTGEPSVAVGINEFTFSVAVFKLNVPEIVSETYIFSFKVSNSVLGNITWDTGSNLGSLFNGEVSTLKVTATSDTMLQYRITSGALPPNLVLLSNGEISGIVASQPTTTKLPIGSTTEFSVTIQAFSPSYSVVSSEKTFTIEVRQEYDQPTDTLYIKAATSIADRQLIRSLLSSDIIFPADSLYRAADNYFGKADDIIYEHLFGIYASTIQEYTAAIEKNHYWRNITLGELKTAVAKNDLGEVIYEVVYSDVIDNLEIPEKARKTVNSMEVTWNTPINLNQGPWYTSITDIYTSYDFYYTSYTPGFTQLVYPNSMYNMRTRLSETITQEFDSKLLPRWMTSQQLDGSTLGYTQAWVIAYTIPGKSDQIKNNIQTMWPHKLNKINFRLDRFTVDKSATFDFDKYLTPPAWTGLPSASPLPDPRDSNDFHVLFPRKTILQTK